LPSDGVVFWPFYERIPFNYTFTRIYGEKPDQSNWYGAFPWGKSEVDGYAPLKSGWKTPEVSFSAVTRQYQRIWVIALHPQMNVVRSLRAYGTVEVVSEPAKIRILRLDTSPPSN
jgi:hypothetical protein